MFSLFYNGPALQHKTYKQALDYREIGAQGKVSYG